MAGGLSLPHSPLLKYTRRSSGWVSRILACSSGSRLVTDMELEGGRKDSYFMGRGGAWKVLPSPEASGYPHQGDKWFTFLFKNGGSQTENGQIEGGALCQVEGPEKGRSRTECLIRSLL